MSMLFPKTPSPFTKRVFCFMGWREQADTRGWLWGKRLNERGSLFHLYWDGPSAPKEAVHHLPLAFRSSWRSCQKSRAQCMLSASFHWLQNFTTNYTFTVKSGCLSGSFLWTLDPSVICFSQWHIQSTCVHSQKNARSLVTMLYLWIFS